MNAAQRLLTNIGAFGPLCNFRDYRLISIAGTPKRKHWCQASSYRAVTVTPARQLKYMHSHARRRLLLIKEAEEEDTARSYCMCGSEVTHSAWEGHTPVSQWDYYNQSCLEAQ